MTANVLNSQGRSRARLVWPLVLGWVVGVVVGCDRSSTDGAVEPPLEMETVTTALNLALSTWRDEGPKRSFERDGWIVQFVDDQPESKRPLRSYEILGEVAGEHRRCMAVRLTLADPEETLTARYFVFGREPTWVYRREDFLMMMHWEHAGDVSIPAKPAEPEHHP